MKKLLILAYDFPPYVSVGGLRPYNWFKYLKEFGVEPIVVTRQWGNEYGDEIDYIAPSKSDKVEFEQSDTGLIILAPYKPNLANKLLLKYGLSKFKLLRKSISAFYEFAQFVFPIGPKRSLYRAARTYLQNNQVDAIVATGDPFVLFHYANKLSKEYGIPWIADYRDPWSQDLSVKTNRLQRKLDLFFEKRTVKTAHLITTVDQLFKEKIYSLFPSERIEIMPNGYDPNAVLQTQSVEQNNTDLSFAFIGTIYEWHPLERMLEAFDHFAKYNEKIEFKLNFYGTNRDELIEKLVYSTYSHLTNKTTIYPKMENSALLEHVAQNNVLLLFNYYAFTGTKIYDYLALKRKIVLCFENDPEALKLKKKYYFKSIETNIQPQIDILHETHSGIVVKDAEHLQVVLMDLWNEFSEMGMIRCNSVGVEKYSRKVQVERLAGVVKALSRNL